MWNKLLGQEKAKEKLTSIFKSGKISHAYLFYGPEGTGKDAAAIEMAKLLNCLNPSDGNACDECSNCKNIGSLKSEYFHFICPLPSGKTGDSDNDPLSNLEPSDYEDYIDQLELKAADPYYKIKLDKANNIKISSIRELISKIYLSGKGEHKKIFLISEADKMKQEAANALLKILEEPPRNCVLILTTSRLNSLPQTVSGRCQKIFFEPIPYKVIEKKLISELGKSFDKNTISIASKFSDGSYSRSKDFLESGIDAIREKALDFMIAILRNDYLNMSLITKDISAKNNKEHLKNFFLFLNLWFRDLLNIKQAGDELNEDIIMNSDKTDRLKKFIKNYPDIDFYGIIMELEESERMIEQNVSSLLIVADLCFKLREKVENPA